MHWCNITAIKLGRMPVQFNGSIVMLLFYILLNSCLFTVLNSVLLQTQFRWQSVQKNPFLLKMEVFSYKKLWKTRLNCAINIRLPTHFFFLSIKLNLNTELYSIAKNYTLEWNGLTYNITQPKVLFPSRFSLLILGGAAGALYPRENCSTSRQQPEQRSAEKKQ